MLFYIAKVERKRRGKQGAEKMTSPLSIVSVNFKCLKIQIVSESQHYLNKSFFFPQLVQHGAYK